VIDNYRPIYSLHFFCELFIIVLFGDTIDNRVVVARPYRETRRSLLWQSQ